MSIHAHINKLRFSKSLQIKKNKRRIKIIQNKLFKNEMQKYWSQFIRILIEVCLFV